MTEIPITEPPPDETSKVRDWRTQELIRAGYDPDVAIRLAADPSLDLHRAIDIVRRGCTPELALRILL